MVQGISRDLFLLQALRVKSISQSPDYTDFPHCFTHGHLPPSLPSAKMGCILMPLRSPGSCLPLSFCIHSGTIHMGQNNPLNPNELISNQNAYCHVRKCTHKSESQGFDIAVDSHSSCHRWVFRESEEPYFTHSKYSIAARDQCICSKIPR